MIVHKNASLVIMTGNLKNVIFEKVKENDNFLWGKTKEKRVCKCYIKIVAILNISSIIEKKTKS